jgi:hypothetical protein
MRSRTSVIRTLAALSLLGTLLVGSACHAWHHFTDPDCSAAGTRGSQPCTSCSALHGGSIATEPEVGPVPEFTSTADVPATSFAVPVVAVVRAAPPRGPPSA